MASRSWVWICSRKARTDRKVRSAWSRSFRRNWPNPRRAMASIRSSALRSFRSSSRTKTSIEAGQFSSSAKQAPSWNRASLASVWSRCFSASSRNESMAELPVLLLGLGQPPVVEGRARVVRARELAEQLVVETNGVVLATRREGRPTLLEQLLGVEALDGQAVGPLAGLDRHGLHFVVDHRRRDRRRRALGSAGGTGAQEGHRHDPAQRKVSARARGRAAFLDIHLDATIEDNSEPSRVPPACSTPLAMRVGRAQNGEPWSHRRPCDRSSLPNESRSGWRRSGRRSPRPCPWAT